MKLAKKSESGQIFVLVLILLALGALLVVPMLNLAYSGQKYHQIVEINTVNAYAADSGIEYARYQIYSDPYKVQTQGVDEHLLIEGIDVHVTAEFDYDAAAYRITSTASTAARSCTIECVIVIDVGLFGKIVACEGNLAINGCQFLSTDEETDADVYVKGDVTLDGNANEPTYIDGTVAASGTVTIKSEKFVTITGQPPIREGAVVMNFPPIDHEIHEYKAKEGGIYNGNYVVSNGIYNLGPLYINGDLTVGANNVNTTLVLGGTVYVTGSVNFVTNPGYTNTLSGFGDIIANGNISFTECKYDLNRTEFLPLLLSVQGNISIQPSSTRPEVQSIVYAPNGTISLTRMSLYGSVAAKAINLTRSTINYPAELRGRADLPGAGLDTVTYQFK